FHFSHMDAIRLVLIRPSFKHRIFSRSASTNLENSNSAVPCGSSSMARNVFPTTLLGMVEVPFCLVYFHTAPGKYNVGSSTRSTPRARRSRVFTRRARSKSRDPFRGRSSPAGPGAAVAAPCARPGHSGMAFGRSEDRIVDRHDVLERDLEK